MNGGWFMTLLYQLYIFLHCKTRMPLGYWAWQCKGTDVPMYLFKYDMVLQWSFAANQARGLSVVKPSYKLQWIVI